MEFILEYVVEQFDEGAYRTIAMWQEPSRFGVDADRHVSEEILDRTFKPNWPRGMYRLTVTRPIRGTTVVRHEALLPLPVQWTALPHPDRAFGYTVLARYPDTNHAMVANHLEAFRRHHHGEITNRTLTEVTGYRVPVGHDPRAAWAPRPDESLATSDSPASAFAAKAGLLLRKRM